MLKTIARAVAFAAVLATPAVAADWSGLYAGVNAGVGKANGQFSDGCYYCATDNYDSTFAFGGVQGGFNWQDGAFVFGPAIGFDLSSLSRSGILGSDDEYQLHESTKMSWFLTALARGGVTVDNAMIFAEAGPVWSHTDTPGVEYCCYGPPGDSPDDVTFSTSGTRAGMAGGFGVEVMTSDNMSVSGEYLYADFGNKKAFIAGDSCDEDTTCDVHNSLTTQLVRIAINWHFMP